MHEDYFSLPIYIYIHSIIISLFIHINKSFWKRNKKRFSFICFSKTLHWRPTKNPTES